jgi:hypothetical protein
MTSDRRRRSPVIQPQLPLSCPPEAEAPRPPSDWQLDEDTRRIGRQGVAAARALLGEPSGGDRDRRLDDRLSDRLDDRLGDRLSDRLSDRLGDRLGDGGAGRLDDGGVDRQESGRRRVGRAGRAA